MVAQIATCVTLSTQPACTELSTPGFRGHPAGGRTVRDLRTARQEVLGSVP